VRQRRGLPDAAQLCGGDAACIANTTGYTVLYKVHRMCTQANTAYNGTSAAASPTSAH